MTKRFSKEMILAVDPSIAATGWALFKKTDKKFYFIDYGCIETKKIQTMPVTIGDIERCKLIAGKLISIITHHGVNILCAEIPLGSQSAAAGKFLGMMKGMIATISVCCGSEEHFINPLQVKKSLCGRSRDVSKDDIAKSADIILNDKTISYKISSHPRVYREAVYDAVAVAISTLDIKKGMI